MLPAACARKASIRWTMPAKTISQATATFTATAARNGEAIATAPNTISKTPHKMETLEACRTISTALFSAIEASLRSGLRLPQKAHDLKSAVVFLRSRWLVDTRGKSADASTLRPAFGLPGLVRAGSSERFGSLIKLSVLRALGHAAAFGRAQISSFRIPAARCGLACVLFRARRFHLSRLRGVSKREHAEPLAADRIRWPALR